MKKLFVVFCMAALSVMFLTPAFGADESKSASSTQQPAAKIRPPQGPMPIDKNIAFVSGSITKIDASVPGSVKLEVINDVDGKSHIVEISGNTNILKVVELGDLKAGDKARVVARKVGDKEVALSVVTGQLKEMQMPRPPVPAQAAAPTTQKGQIKK